jgi:hypothetical protein
MPLFLLLWYTISGVFHPFHVSVCDVAMNTDKSRLEITQKIFIDDLEIALRQFSNDSKLDIIKESDQQEFQALIKRYFIQKVRIKANDKLVEYSFLGAEKEGDVLWCYLEVSNIKQLKVFEIENSILTDAFDDQMNLVHVKVEGKTKSLRLRQNETSGSLTF